MSAGGADMPSVAVFEPQPLLQARVEQLVVGAGYEIATSADDADLLLVCLDSPFAGWSEHLPDLSARRCVVSAIRAQEGDDRPGRVVLTRPFDVERLGRALRLAAEASIPSDAETVRLAASEAVGLLDADVLEMLAVAANLIGRDQESIRAWERAHGEHLRGGRPDRAAPKTRG